MKKFLMTLAAATLMAISAQAQVYIGGSIGIGSVKNFNGDTETTYKFLPEVGFALNNDWSLGVQAGLIKGACDFSETAFAQDTETEAVTINPYARYTFLHGKAVNAFIDGGIGYTSYDDVGSEFNIGLRPGLSVKLNNKACFVTHIGFLGYRTFNPDADNLDNSHVFGLDLDGSNITFGLYYTF